MNKENAIEVRDLRKKFKIYLDKGHMLKERIIFANRNKHEDRWVLNGISFNVKKGEAIGLIGKNGCGKSTTLKLLNRIIYPNGGTVEINGKVSSLIELGAGFHEDMTGRENIYINASIFGLTRKEIDARIDDIIRFSELEKFIDNPVRTYSSGMYMRLAFSVAINVDADVLLIDEILAVGDVNFQEKCFQKLRDVKRNGTTIVIVSHSLGQIEKICDRAIWIDEGLIKEDGTPRAICKHYLESMEYDRLERAEQEYVMQKQAQEKKKQEEEKKKQEAEKRKKDELERKKEEVRRKQEEEKRKKLKEEAEERARRKKEEERQIKNSTCRDVCKQCGPDARREGSGEIEFSSVKVLDSKGQETTKFSVGEDITVCVKCIQNTKNIKAKVSVGITRSDWIYCFGTSTFRDKKAYVPLADYEEIKFTFNNALLQGKYYFDLSIEDENGRLIDALYSIVEFSVNDTPDVAGVIKMNYIWDYK